MKKKLLIICILFLLCSCIPTPVDIAVVGKDANKKENLNQNENECLSEQTLLDKSMYEECVPINKGLLKEIVFETSIINGSLTDCSIYTIKPTTFEPETIEHVINAFAPGTHVVLGDATFTYEDIKQSIEQTLYQINNIDLFEFESEEDKTQFLEELHQDLKDLQKAYQKSKDTVIELVSLSELTKFEKVSFILLDDSERSVAQGLLTCGIELGDPRSSVLSLSYLNIDTSTLERTTDYERLITVCESYIKSAKIEGFEFNRVLTEGDSSRIVFTKTIAGIPYSYAFEMTELQSQDYFEGSLFSEPYWLDESIQFDCFGNQVTGVTWYSKSDYGSSIRDHITPLSFSEVKDKIINGLIFLYSLPIDEKEESHRIVISTLQLGYKRAPVYNAVGQYELIPVWTVIGKKIQKYHRSQDAPELVLDQNNEWSYPEENILLVISAIDGSIIG